MNLSNKIKIGIAILLLSAIPVWKWIVAPEITKLPVNFAFTADVVSTDNFYNEENKSFSGEQYSKTIYRYETLSSSEQSLVIKNIFDVRTPEGQPIFSVERLYGIDRKTGAHVSGLGDKNREGYLFAPRHLKQGDSFVYWHINYDAPAQMSFVREEMLYGLRVFRYETYFQGEHIDQTANLGFLPGVGKTRGVELDPYLELWVEPVTGQLIKYKDNTIAYYYDFTTQERLYPWNHFSNTFQEESVKTNVENALREKTQSRIVDVYIPILSLLISIFILLKGSSVLARLKKGAHANVVGASISLFIIGSGLIVIAGWIVGSEGIIRFFSNQNGMNPLSAVCFIIMGLGVFFKNAFRGRVIMVAGIILAALAFLRLLTFYGIIPFGIDLVLFRETLSEIPARMGLFTAVSFLSFGLVFLTVKNAYMRRWRIVEVVTTVVFLCSLLVLFGHIFEALNILSSILFFSIAMHTAILLALSSIVIFIVFRGYDGNKLSVQNSLIILGLIFSMLLASVVTASFTRASFGNEARNNFDVEAERAKTLIENRLQIYINALNGGKGLFVSSEVVERGEWKSYVEALNLEKNLPGIQGMVYVQLVSASERNAHSAKIRAEGFPAYTISPPGERSLYAPVVYIEPFNTENQRAFGYDLWSEPVRRFALQQARDTGSPKMTGKITLVQETDEDIQPGFLIFVPFYANGAPAGTVDERRKSIVGYIDAPFRARDFIEGVIAKEGLKGIGLRINDGTSISQKTELYNDTGKKIESGATSRFLATKTMYIGGRPWTLTFSSVPDYGENSFDRLLPFIIILFGGGVGILLAFIFYSLISSRQKAITYAEEVTKDLSLAKSKDEAILESIGDGLIVTNKDGNILLVNHAFEDAMGWKENEVKGKSFVDVIPMIDQNNKPIAITERLFSKVLNSRTTTTTTTTYYFVRKDQTAFPVAATVTPIIIDGGLVGAVGVFRDITKEKDIDKVKTEFVSLASHQLRTPLSTINWYTEMLIAGDAGSINDKQKKFLGEIYTGSQRMVELVNALLNVSRLELGTFVVEPEPTDVVKLAQSVIDEQKPQFEAKKLKIKSLFAKDVPIISFDQKLLRMMFQNLLSNSVKYTPEGGNLEFEIILQNKDILIRVSDTGYGITKGQQNKIFTKLFRADNVKEKDTEGTGLGLYIVKSIVDHSGGKIWFESEENKGTTFYITLSLEGMKKKEGDKAIS